MFEAAPTQPGPPLWLLAELTYRCPLQCPYCSNPLEFAKIKDELDTDTWLRVLREGREAGAVQLGFSGGEPLLRDDLDVLVREACQMGYYTNLLTSGMGLDKTRVAALKEAGLDHIQISFQDSDEDTANHIAGSRKAFQQKLAMAEAIKANDYPMVVNIVLHRDNIDHLDTFLDLCAQMGADYVELANAQYYGWGLVNRDRLMPTREQLVEAEAVTQRYRQQHGERMKLFFVVPDYYETKPKACMSGWGSLFLTVTPDGTALPCHSARDLPLQFPNVRDTSIHDIWYQSSGFNQFRGDEWMKAPCRTCPDKEKDYGGCRCQAYLLTGDMANADPVCEKSEHHHLIEEAVARAQTCAQHNEDVQPLIFRNTHNSKKVIDGTLS